jgi:hypothetical protein
VIEDTMRTLGAGARRSLASLAAVLAPPASAQVVTLDELDGAAIESRTRLRSGSHELRTV